ncbi:hypothetical protein [Desulforhopalus sp. 52FAK]
MKDTKNFHWPARYQIEVVGELGLQWSDWFEGAEVSAGHGRTLFISNEIDQQGLHGLLIRIRDLGLPLISLKRMGLNNTNFCDDEVRQ